MARITQYSRISHHTIAGSASTGLTFSIPPQEDFTDGSWTPYDLALSEIGVNEQDERVFIRIDDTIKEFAFIGASGVGFTGGPGNCITDLYLTNMYGCSPITIHDDFIQKDGTSVNSEDSNLQITFDAGGVGTFDVQKINGTTTQLERLTVGDYGIQIQTTATNSNVSGFILCEDTNQSGTDINIQLESISAPDSSRIQLGPSSSLWRTSDGTLYDNRITINTTDMIFKAEDLLAVTYGELQLTHAVSFFSHYNNGLLSYIQAQDNTIDIQTQGSGALNKIALDSSNNNIEITTTSQFNDISFIETSYNTLAASPVVRLKTEDVTTNIVSELTLSNSAFISTVSNLSSTTFIAQSPTEINLTSATYVINVKNTQIELNKPLLNTGAWIHKIENERTVNSTPTRLDVINFNIPNRVISITATINAYSSTTDQAYASKLFAAFKNVSGSLTQLGTTDKVECTDFTTATSDILIVNPFGTDIDIQVIGETASSILWTTRYEYQITP